jgi:hypothetical protein
VLRKPGNMQAIDDAYDYLKKIGYLKWAGDLASQWRRSSSGTGAGFRPRGQATSAKHQAASSKRQAWQEIII